MRYEKKLKRCREWKSADGSPDVSGKVSPELPEISLKEFDDPDLNERLFKLFWFNKAASFRP